MKDFIRLGRDEKKKLSTKQKNVTIREKKDKFEYKLNETAFRIHNNMIAGFNIHIQIRININFVCL